MLKEFPITGHKRKGSIIGTLPAGKVLLGDEE